MPTSRRRSRRIRSRSCSSLAPTRSKSIQPSCDALDRVAGPQRLGAAAGRLAVTLAGTRDRLEPQPVDQVLANRTREQDRVDARVGESAADDGRGQIDEVLVADPDPTAEIGRPAAQDAREDARRNGAVGEERHTGRQVDPEGGAGEHEPAVGIGDAHVLREKAAGERHVLDLARPVLDRQEPLRARSAARPDRTSPARRGAAGPSRSAP